MKPVYDSDLEIPIDIREAAALIENWTKMRGLRDWEIMGVADRKLVDKLCQELGKLRRELDDLRYELLESKERYESQN